MIGQRMKFNLSEDDEIEWLAFHNPIEVKAVILTVTLTRLGLSIEDCPDTLCAFNYFDDVPYIIALQHCN